MNKKQALQKIEELKNFIKQEEQEFVKVGYNEIPKEVFDKYGAKPFEIMKKKMRKNGEVWNEIDYFDAQKECEKLGYRLPKIQEMLVLLDWYKQKSKEVSCKDKEFLGIEELSYEEDVFYEWIYCSEDITAIRGGNWYNGASGGCFTLNLTNAPSYTYSHLGFRCCR